ncbi:MAG TPA: M14 family zinc carboxypeptidase [Longimicrobiales bacterium]|nr:M14 family zinc carboxypeptidase [Longimicrobiales bacterium]
MSCVLRALTLSCIAIVAAGSAKAQNPVPFPADTRWDPAIPQPSAFLGHDPADVVTTPEDIVRYMRALAAAAPERTRLVEYAQSHEGRPLVMLAIGAEARMARLADVQAGLARLADPRGLSPADETALIAELPVVTALVHSIHGNEISGAGAAIAAAYYLLAAQGDPDVDTILRESIVIIDPIQNPDGRARFVFQNQLHRAADPDPDPVAAERDEPWPGGRTNHYLFDLNRDWYALTQPESRGRIRALLEWNPHVVVDLHEMGANATYYFPPAAVPGNPFTTDAQKELLELVGRGNADAFDSRGWPYFIREVYDAFYPGYGASWPTAQGALGHTFEMASARGLEVIRYDGSMLTYGDGIARHFTAGQRTALTAALNRERVLRAFVEFRRSAAAEGERGTRGWVLDAGRDPMLATRLARTLAQNGIEVYRSAEAITADGRTLPTGSYVVPLNQPAARLARNLLERQVDMDSAFVRLQRERRARRLPDQIYDITAWNLPLMWNVAAVPLESTLPASGEMVSADPFAPAFAAIPRLPSIDAAGSSGATTGGLGAAATVRDRAGPEGLPDARVGYLIPWNTAAAAALVELQAAGIRVHASGAALAVEGRRHGIGTLFVRRSDVEAPGAREALARAADRHGVDLVPVRDGFVGEGGISLGSNQMRALPGRRVVLLWDQPTSSQSAGWARWVLEQRYGQRVTAVRVGSFGRLDLADVGVIVVPEGNYAGSLDVARLRRWIQDGGTLITMGESTRWATRDDVGLLATRAELRAGSGEEGPEDRQPPAAGSQPIDYLDAIVPDSEAPEPVPGALVRVLADTSHILAAGTGGELAAMVNSSRIFSPLTLDRGTNVGSYAGVDDMLLSGIIWEETRPQLANKAFLMHQPLGRGRIVAFAEDPNFRGYAEGTMLLFMNAVLLAPGF